ncbi:MAG: HEAT repeat domain-containing protein [Candidatus Polarisedimenticolia bacterium]
MRFGALGLCFWIALSSQPYAGLQESDDDVEPMEPDETFVEAMEASGSVSIATRLKAAEAVAHSSYEENPATVAAVVDWMLSEKDPWVRFILAETLVESIRKEDAVLLLSHMEHPDPVVRSHVLPLLKDQYMSADLEMRLVTMWHEEQFWWVRTEILPALARGYGDASMDALHMGLWDPSRSVVDAALNAVKRRADPRSVAPLLSAWLRVLEMELPAGPEAMGSLADVNGIPAVERATESPHPRMRSEAASALAALRARGSAPVLIGLLEDPSPEVSRAALEALIELGSAEALSTILRHAALDEGRSLVAPLASMKGGDALQVCLDLAAGEREKESQERISRLCEAMKGLRETGTVTVNFTIGCVLGWSAPPLDPRIRVVTSRRRPEAISWSPSPGSKRGGVPSLMNPGEKVIVDGALYDGSETWLSVVKAGARRPVWMRERDLEEVNAAPREAEASRGHR